MQEILNAVQAASELCRLVQQKFVVISQKVEAEPVTIADYGSQAIIGRAIREYFPHDSVLAEESGEQFIELVAEENRREVCNLLEEILGESVTQDKVVDWLNQGSGQNAERVWVIDPIDGTKGFLGLRRYTIAVGLLINGVPQESVMGCPGYPHADGIGQVFFTEGGKAFVKPIGSSNARPIRVSTSLSSTVRIAESVETAHADHDRMAEIYRLAGFENPVLERVDGQDKYALVACGDADLYFRLSPKKNYQHKAWDHTAGYALVKAAGGVVSDLDGSPLDFSQGKVLPNHGMVVSNGLVHEALLKALAQVAV